MKHLTDDQLLQMEYVIKESQLMGKKIALVVLHAQQIPSLADKGFQYIIYTVGMTDFNLPEMVMLTLHYETPCQLLVALSMEAEKNGRWADGWTDLELEYGNVPIRIHDLRPHQVNQYVEGATHWYAQEGKWPEFQQVIVGDPQGNLPGEPEYMLDYMQNVYGQKHLWEGQNASQLH